jgi:hypothetical protein
MGQEDQYWKQASVSMPNSKPLAQPTTTSQAQAALDRSTWINKCAQMVFGSYRRDDFSDPECFRVQLAGILERYPDKIIREATHYNSGIQRTCKFPPSIAEVVEFCDELKRRSHYAKDWDERSRKQLDERDQIQSGQDREPVEHRKKVVERVLQEYRSRIHSDDKKEQVETPESAKAKLGLTDEQWDTIPDQAPDKWQSLQKAAKIA